MKSVRRLPHRSAMLISLLVSAASLAGCGGSSESESGATSPTELAPEPSSDEGGPPPTVADTTASTEAPAVTEPVPDSTVAETTVPVAPAVVTPTGETCLGANDESIAAATAGAVTGDGPLPVMDNYEGGANCFFDVTAKLPDGVRSGTLMTVVTSLYDPAEHVALNGQPATFAELLAENERCCNAVLAQDSDLGNAAFSVVFDGEFTGTGVYLSIGERTIVASIIAPSGITDEDWAILQPVALEWARAIATSMTTAEL